MSINNIINLKDALHLAKTDERVGIAIAPLSTEHDFCLFTAEIKKGNKVGCHYHTESKEIYSILSGEGIIYMASVNEKGHAGEVNSYSVAAGDNFTIEPGTAHQLKATSDLVLTFVCPPTHLSSDRTMLPCLA